MRYQVLFDGGHVDVRTRAQAEREASKLRKAGKRNVQVWDTLDNALSRLLRF